ncbi:MAG: hypothetical protein HOV94_32820 [Saccharothrix sp.]|nr:hypothetical protein [Saccharothrix sp.]
MADQETTEDIGVTDDDSPVNPPDDVPPTAAEAAEPADDEDDVIEDLEFLIDDIEDQIAPLGL